MRRPGPRAVLFVLLAAGLALIAVAAVRGRAWIVAVAAAALAVWMGELAARDLGLLGRRRRRS
jgi:hypothetical protein